ncbi:MAG TPA: hypothetical protein DCX32_01460 [Candidatus Moranbacteria bacterium]|nr:MAG: hypothetical protein UW95_C0007G0031 [Parcubacteria group bacterium GW2011_GWC1_45_14]HAV11189.1 hypothetical protein [Candidatus Moranbacteria bacterium]
MRKEEIIMYRAFVKKETPVTTAEMMAIDVNVREKILPLIINPTYDIQIRSNALAPKRKDQYVCVEALTDEKWLETIRSADIFQMIFSVWSSKCYIQICLRGLKNIGRNIVLIACDNDIVYHQLRKVFETIFPDCYTDDRNEARKTMEQFDAETWDPDMEDDGEDHALDKLNKMR